MPIPYWMEGAPPTWLIVRRVKPTPGSQLALFARYSYHAFITDRDGETLELEADHRRHAEIENAIRDLKYGVGLNHLPSGRFAANGALAGGAGDGPQPRPLDSEDRPGRADSDHQDSPTTILRFGGTAHPLGAPPHFASATALALGNPVQPPLGTAAHSASPSLTARPVSEPSNRITERPRQLAPARSVRVSCCVPSPLSRPTQRPQTVTRSPCGE